MDRSGWYWMAWLLVVFLPRELWAAVATPGRPDSLSEFIWRAFGVPRRGLYVAVPWAPARRIALAAFIGSLGTHLVLGWSVLPVVLFGAGVAAVLVRAAFLERGNP